MRKANHFFRTVIHPLPSRCACATCGGCRWWTGRATSRCCWSWPGRTASCSGGRRTSGSGTQSSSTSPPRPGPRVSTLSTARTPSGGGRRRRSRGRGWCRDAPRAPAPALGCRTRGRPAWPRWIGGTAPDTAAEQRVTVSRIGYLDLSSSMTFNLKKQSN